MILSGQTIRQLGIVTPFREKTVAYGMSGGLSHAGYDIHIGETITLPRWDFILAFSEEEFEMPNNIMGFVKEKSTWARKGLDIKNTVIEPGWKGFLTLELLSVREDLVIYKGCPIAQIVFMYTDLPVEKTYSGKYQNQGAEAVDARYENPQI